MRTTLALSAAILLLAPAGRAQRVPGGMVDQYLTVLAKRCWEARAAAVARLRTPAEINERQRYIRSRILEEIGGFPEKTPLNPRITGTLDRDGYRVEKLIYESMPKFYVTANVYVPSGGTPPFPAVLGTAGHSLGGKAFDLYQRVWIALAKRGFLVLAYDPPGQGERCEYFDAAAGKPIIWGTAEHTMAGMQCLLTGTNYARYEMWDGVRAYDYLLTRPDVDPQRIAAAGNSGGGTQTNYLQVLEPRLAAATPSCYLTSWEKLWSGPGPQDAEQVFAGFLKDGLDFPDFLIAFAPKPVKMMTAIKDFFPIDGARATYAEARRVYETLGAQDRIGFFEFDDSHGWSRPRREATYQWLERWLNHRPDDEGREPEFQTEPEANLRCTPTGQVITSLKGETVQSLNRALAERLYTGRTASRLRNAARLRDLIAARLGEPGLAGRRRPLKAATDSEAQGGPGYRVHNIVLEPEEGIRISALLAVPESGPARKPAVLLVNPAGRAADAAPGGDIEALAKAGRIVLAPDLRGWGASAPSERSGGYSSLYQTAMRALLVGRTLAGMCTFDLLRSFDYLVSRPDVDSRQISVLGKANAGVIALFAAALEPRLQRVAVEGAVLSYLDIVRAPTHQKIIGLVVPGVLRDFDLPDVAGALGSRALWIVEPRTPAGSPASLEEASREYPRAHVAARQGSFNATYAGWLGR